MISVGDFVVLLGVRVELRNRNLVRNLFLKKNYKNPHLQGAMSVESFMGGPCKVFVPGMTTPEPIFRQALAPFAAMVEASRAAWISDTPALLGALPLRSPSTVGALPTRVDEGVDCLALVLGVGVPAAHSFSAPVLAVWDGTGAGDPASVAAALRTQQCKDRWHVLTPGACPVRGAVAAARVYNETLAARVAAEPAAFCGRWVVLRNWAVAVAPADPEPVRLLGRTQSSLMRCPASAGAVQRLLSSYADVVGTAEAGVHPILRPHSALHDASEVRDTPAETIAAASESGPTAASAAAAAAATAEPGSREAAAAVAATAEAKERALAANLAKRRRTRPIGGLLRPAEAEAKRRRAAVQMPIRSLAAVAVFTGRTAGAAAVVHTRVEHAAVTPATAARRLAVCRLHDGSVTVRAVAEGAAVVAALEAAAGRDDRVLVVVTPMRMTLPQSLLRGAPRVPTSTVPDPESLTQGLFAGSQIDFDPGNVSDSADERLAAETAPDCRVSTLLVTAVL